MSGGISHLIAPLKAKANRSCGVVQGYSQLQCGNTVNLMLSTLQSILVPALHYGCQLWGVHIPTGEAKAAQADLQFIYDRFPRRICGVKHAPRAVLLEELALSPLQVFWWQQTGTQLLLVLVIPFFIPFSIYDIHDGFHVGHGATDFSSSTATCLQSVGWSMPCESSVIPVMEVAAVVEALRKHLQGTHSHALHCWGMLGLSAAPPLVL